MFELDGDVCDDDVWDENAEEDDNDDVKVDYLPPDDYDDLDGVYGMKNTVDEGVDIEED